MEKFIARDREKERYCLSVNTWSIYWERESRWTDDDCLDANSKFSNSNFFKKWARDKQSVNWDTNERWQPRIENRHWPKSIFNRLPLLGVELNGSFFFNSKIEKLSLKKLFLSLIDSLFSKKEFNFQP